MYVRVKVKPGAKKELIKQIGEFVYEISVKEKPERNQANKRVRELLARHLNKEVGNIRLVSGHHMPIKMFSVSD